MLSVSTNQARMVSRDLIGNPAAARHGKSIEPLRARGVFEVIIISPSCSFVPFVVGFLTEDVFHFPYQRAALWLVLYLGRAFQFLQQFALTLTELGWSLDTKLDKQIALAMAI